MTAVVGVDLSLTSTGVCSIEDGKVDCLFHIPTAGKKGDDLVQRYARLDGIAWKVTEFIEEDYTDLVVIEGPSYGSRGGSAHDRAGLWWMVVGDVLAMDIPVAVVSPQGRAKYGTGSGRSSKEDVYAAVVEHYSALLTDPLPAFKDGGNDEADALLMAAMGARYLGQPIEAFEPGEANLASLEGVQWPSV